MAIYAGLAAPVPAASDDASKPALVWPLDSTPRAITGTFMEPRSIHYHTGLDIKTEARRGLPVLAPADGSVVRLRTTPEGYGIAIYLLLDDGRTLVFAHLDHFSDRLRAPIVEAWERSGVYQQHLRLPPGELRVAAGELIGLSGATGTGAPHLHFEVRDTAERPLNPLLHGFEVPDHEAPRVGGVKLVPLSTSARVSGRGRDVEVALGDTIEATGRLGVQAQVEDFTGIYRHRLMPLGVAVELNGREVYRMEQQRHAFSQGRQMQLEVVRDYHAGKRWVRLYRRPGNDLPGRQATVPHATLDLLDDGAVHELTVRAWDAAGNSAQEHVWVRATAPAWIQPDPAVGIEGWGYEVDAFEGGLEVRIQGERCPQLVNHSAAVGGTYPVSESDGEFVVLIPWSDLRSGPLQFGVGDLPLSAPAPFDLVVADTGTVEVRSFEIDNVSEALAGGGGLWVLREGIPRQYSRRQLPEGAQFVDYLGHLNGEGMSLQEDLVIRVRLDEVPSRPIGLFLQNPRDGWEFLGSVVQRDGSAMLEGETNEMGSLVVLADALPPYLGTPRRQGEKPRGNPVQVRPRDERGWRGVTLPKWETVEVPLKDPGAGLEADGIDVRLDGARFPARWDPEEERVYLEFWIDPGPGAHQLDVEVSDRLGNRVAKTFELQLIE